MSPLPIARGPRNLCQNATNRLRGHLMAEVDLEQIHNDLAGIADQLDLMVDALLALALAQSDDAKVVDVSRVLLQGVNRKVLSSRLRLLDRPDNSE
jgi:hypothetical protein